MGSLKLMLLTVLFCAHLATHVSARVQGQKDQNLLNEKESSKQNNDKFETLSKMQGSSENRKQETHITWRKSNESTGPGR
jgi:hypothetical protein